ncbi:MAG: hypothetical protein ACM3OB_05745 [Acidobacteriota bacterium]
MKSLSLPVLLIVCGNVVYQLSQKSMPKTANPLLTMLLAYAVSMTICAVAAAILPAGPGLVQSIRTANWAVVALGAGIAMVEIGYLTAYRLGWKISVLPVMSSVVVALLLIPIGLLLFHEHITPRSLLGIALCIGGLILLHR